jgi:hypothetical protein
MTTTPFDRWLAMSEAEKQEAMAQQMARQNIAEGYQLYNVTVRMVDLVWARTEDDAIDAARARLSLAGIEPLADTGDTAFVSEPVESMYWPGAATCASCGWEIELHADGWLDRGGTPCCHTGLGNIPHQPVMP